MADRHVQQFRGVGAELARQYMWEFSIPRIPGGQAGSQGGGGEGGRLGQFTFRAISTSLPDKAVETYQHNFKSTFTNHAGRDASTKSFDCTFIDAIDLVIYKNMFSWVAFTKENHKSAYAVDNVIIRLQDRNDDVILTMKMFQAYPENLQQVTLDYGVNDPVNIPITFRFDDIELEGEEGGSSANQFTGQSTG